jgi:hypothetical protein
LSPFIPGLDRLRQGGLILANLFRFLFLFVFFFAGRDDGPGAEC